MPHLTVAASGRSDSLIVDICTSVFAAYNS
jgi:hypothetical protein